VLGLPKWFGHVNLNVRQLERSEAFYQDVVGLGPVIRMAPTFDQRGDVFEIPELVRWNGLLMGDDRRERGPVLDVLQWEPAVAEDALVETPTGHRWGLNRLLFTDPDPAAIAERAVAFGCEANWVDFEVDGVAGAKALHLRDPDGTHLEVRQAGAALRFTGVRLNCNSLARSTSFYQRVLRMGIKEDSVSVIDGSRVHRRLLGFEGARDTFGIELCEPEPDVLLPRALAPGNHPGLYRMALVTSDFPASLAHLNKILPEKPRVARVDLGSGVGPLDAVFFEDPDGAVVEFVEHGFIEVARRNSTQSS
jgi:catechol 2,3-dioxygenase-like lactoylglutathione lyase family enzyme